MSIIPLHSFVRTDDILNNTNLLFSDEYIKSREVRSNVAEREGVSFRKNLKSTSVDALSLMHNDSGLGLDSDSLSILVDMYHPESSISKYSSDRLNFKYKRESTIYFYPKADVSINWNEVEWSNTGLPMNIIVHTNQSGFTYSARINLKGKSYHSCVFQTSEEAVLAQKQMEYMKSVGFI